MHIEKTLQMYFPHAGMPLVCGHIVFKCILNTTDISENGEKFVQIPFCIFLYVDTELRIPEAFPCPFGKDAENAGTGILSMNNIGDQYL